jgi:hypothetical protein
MLACSGCVSDIANIVKMLQNPFVEYTCCVLDNVTDIALILLLSSSSH